MGAGDWRNWEDGLHIFAAYIWAAVYANRDQQYAVDHVIVFFSRISPGQRTTVAAKTLPPLTLEDAENCFAGISILTGRNLVGVAKILSGWPNTIWADKFGSL